MSKTENNIICGDFYNHLSPDEKQVCDLCRDWGMGGCRDCYIYNRRKESDSVIVLYTIDCPSCLVLERKLKDKNIQFLRVSDKDTIIAKGFGDSTFPILEVDGVVMSYKTAIQWINNQ